jgi:hypothetical protein
MYEYKVFTSEEMQDFMQLNRHESHYKKNGSQVYVGFHYLKPEHIFTYTLMPTFFTQPEIYYFCALEDNKLVGIMRLIQNADSKLYEFYIDYIDINENHRLKGIATNIYELVNEWFQHKPQTVILGTSLSVEGEQAKLHDLRKKIITNCKTFTSRDELREYKRNIFATC